MPHPRNLAGVEWALFEQAPHPVGQLNFPGAIARRLFEGRENVRRQDITADDGQIRRRVVPRRLLDKVDDAVDARSEVRVIDGNNAVAGDVFWRHALDGDYWPIHSLEHIHHLPERRPRRVDHIVGQQHGEGFISHEVFRDEYRMPQAKRFALAYRRDVDSLREATNLFELLGLTTPLEERLQFIGHVEVVLHDALATARDEDDVFDARLQRFLDAVLNDWPIDEDQHLLGQHLRAGKKASAKARGGKNGLSNGALHAGHTIAGRIGTMIDPAILRDNLEGLRSVLERRGVDLSSELEDLATLETRRRRILPELEGLKREQNTAADEVARAKRQGLNSAPIQEANRQRAQQIKQLTIELESVEQRRNRGLLTIPNVPHESVPVGKSSADNVEVRRHGTPRTFSFTAQAHWDLGPALGIIDFERGTKIAGARFSVLIGAGARLERALINFMLHLHTTSHGYTEVEPPFMVNTASLTGTGNLPKFEADLFKIAGDWDLYMVPTAEVPLTNMHRGEILSRPLPIRYTAYTPCFRSEAGSYGADVRGLIRQHQFDKVELMTFAEPDQSYDELERLTASAEEVLKRLELPYRTVALCTGDLGFASAKTYDIEVWLPGQNTYREISSCTNTEAFQARRANIKYRPQGTGKAEFVHTLNGSGLAVGRTLIALLENYQQEDGSVVIPDALRPFMDGAEVIKAN